MPEQVVQLIRSFHQEMQARIHLDGELLEAIDVKSCLRRCCCISPVLFKLCTCLMLEYYAEWRAFLVLEPS